MWGRGEYGRLGLGDKSGSSKLRPQKVRLAGRQAGPRCRAATLPLRFECWPCQHGVATATHTPRPPLGLFQSTPPQPANCNAIQPGAQPNPHPLQVKELEGRRQSIPTSAGAYPQ